MTFRLHDQLLSILHCHCHP
uniref:Uncharacterized protein n=1 Tax=Anguilla anguilla TaxID=7936 RepID=A0A0E9XU28_ANGAN